MGLQLPGELTTFLNIIGYKWPQADEEKLFDVGKTMMGFSDKLKTVSDDAKNAATKVISDLKGQDINSFADHWQHQDGPVKVLGDSSTASKLLGAGMTICAAIVLALKVQVIIQLVTLAIQTAQAIAAAVATFGASLAEIPVFQQICRTIVGQLLDAVIGKLLHA